MLYPRFVASHPSKSIRVVAALVEREGRYLITQRRPTAVLPLLWEFPGGRVETGETDSHGLGINWRPGPLDAEAGAELGRQIARLL